MSQNSVKLLGIHLALLALMIFCLMHAGDGNGQPFTFAAGFLAWPVFASLRDVFKEVLSTIRAS